MLSRLRFLLNRIRERLWVRPLMMCILSIVLALLARAVDHTEIAHALPEVSTETIETLLKILAASMLVIATFAVGSMVSSYASASGTATPRSFSLVISDDVTQNALSGFIGAFIFSIVALIALLNGFYGPAGGFAIFCLTLFVFAVVILIFVRWVDRIARLGRLGSTIEKVEDAAAAALRDRRDAPTLGGAQARDLPDNHIPIFGFEIGYVQRVDCQKLQHLAEEAGVRIALAALPGTFSAPGRALAHILPNDSQPHEDLKDQIAKTFQIGHGRIFEEDPRFGLVVLAEIAGRALSPAVNDPGTAIDILGSLVRLFVLWNQKPAEKSAGQLTYDRVEVPLLSTDDLFDDAFTAIGRDGAGSIEVGVRLQKALHSLASLGDPAMQAAATRHARMALARAEKAMDLPDDLQAIRQLSAFAR